MRGKITRWMPAVIVGAGFLLLPNCAQSSRADGPPEPQRTLDEATWKLEELAFGLQQKTLSSLTGKDAELALLTIRRASLNQDANIDGPLLVIARDVGGLNPQLAMEAMGQLSARGKCRAELRGFVEGWHGNHERATSAMQVLATEPTAEELELFHKVALEAFEEMPPGEFASGGQYTSYGEGVVHWIKSLDELEGAARIQEIARIAAPVAACPIDYPDPAGYWNPWGRRAAIELRKQYELDPLGVLLVLRDKPLLEPDSPDGPPSPSSLGAAERKKLEATWREGLISILPAPARAQWAELNAR